MNDSSPEYVVELVGGRPVRRRGIAYPEIPRVFIVKHLGTEFQRGIVFWHGVFIVEHYRIEPTTAPGYYRGIYTGITRGDELPRTFNPARLPN